MVWDISDDERAYIELRVKRHISLSSCIKYYLWRKIWYWRLYIRCTNRSKVISIPDWKCHRSKSIIIIIMNLPVCSICMAIVPPYLWTSLVTILWFSISCFETRIPAVRWPRPALFGPTPPVTINPTSPLALSNRYFINMHWFQPFGKVCCHLL